MNVIGKLVPVAAISVAMEDTGIPNEGPAALLEYLEEIVGGFHPSLGLDILLQTCFSGAGGTSYWPDCDSST